VESGAEAESGVASGDVRWINSEDGSGVAENGGLELAPEVVIGGEGEGGVEGVVLADEPYSVVSVLNNLRGGGGSGGDKSEGEGSIASGGTRAIDLSGALEQFN